MVLPSQPSVRPKGWTRTHSYFLVMGGFGDNVPLWNPLEITAPAGEAELAQNSITSPRQENTEPEFRTLVTELAILDKSKSDPLGKLFTLLQTTWFIVQYLERWIIHQPRMQLEVMTLAYAAMNFLIYALWWGKPLNIQEPINLLGQHSAPDDDHTKGLNGVGPVLVEAFKLPHMEVGGSDGDFLFFSMVFPIVGILFGVHCFAWWFPFPTSQEKVLWRVCAVFCTATPCLVALHCFLVLALDSSPRWIKPILIILVAPFQMCYALVDWLGSSSSYEVQVLIGAALPLIPYIACRIILVVLTFTSLRAPVPGIYEATLWPSFLPHFG